jgi:cytoskeletal protein RodZ
VTIDDEDDEPRWHDHQNVVIAAGIAAVLLLALLVWAVINTSRWSMSPNTPAPETSAVTSPSARTTKTTSSTSYSVPRVQTSQDNPVFTGPPGESTTQGPAGPETTETPTTSTNPYPTTTPTNAGHI